MAGEKVNYNEFLSKVVPPRTIYEETIGSAAVLEVRDQFFNDVKHAFEPRLSYLALDSATHVDWVSSPAVEGAPAHDISSELILHDPNRRSIQPIAMVFQSQERSLEEVHFMVLPLNRYGNVALRWLERADEAFSRATN